MMHISQIALALDAKLVGADVTFSSVNTDSRKIRQGDLFVALRGERFDGYEYVMSSLQSGAVACLVNADSYAAAPCNLQAASCILVVKDTRIALGKLAAYWRAQFEAYLVAITGSNGKTTVKEMLASILSIAAGDASKVLATLGNFNNDIGMPLTLLRMNKQHRYAVIEMGMNHFGEIDYLTRLAQPQVALVNNASGAHLLGLGSVEGVARAKGEIFAGLRSDGIAVINADDEHATLWRKMANGHHVLDFGLSNKAMIQGSWSAQGYGGVLKVQTPVGDMDVRLQVPGMHNARNALAATAAAIALHIPLVMIKQGLEDFGGVSGRLQRKQASNGATVIDDTYNANPASVHAALEVLAQTKGKRIFVLGDMGELGVDAAQFHKDIGKAARGLGIEQVYALGDMSVGAVAEFGAGARHYQELDALCAALDKEMDSHSTVLIKGSRFMKMERIVAHCVGTTLTEVH